MANYNTFVVCNCKKRTVELVTSSARKAKAMLEKGKRIEIWNENERVKTVYANQDVMNMYIKAEKEHIGIKQSQAQARNLKKGIMRM